MDQDKDCDLGVMNEGQMEQALRELLDAIAVTDADDLHETNYTLGLSLGMLEALNGAKVRSYEEAGLLTRDNGVVIRFKSGLEFQITVKRSR